MKGTFLTSTIILLFFLSLTSTAFSQTNVIADDFSYQNLNEDINRLIEQAGSKKIVALGEGTHGTKEFNEVRSLLTQRFIKEKGFNYVLFESNYGGAYALNEDLKDNAIDLSKSIKDNLIAIWHTKEIQDFFRWTADYNKQSKVPVTVVGIDYSELSTSFNQVKYLLTDYGFTNKDKILNELQGYVLSQDEIWNNLNNRKFKFDRKKWISNGVKAYELIKNVETEVGKQTTTSPKLKTGLLNLKLGFETIHLYTTQKKDASRDSCMAEMLKSVLQQDPNAKVLVWAHNVHVANRPVYSGNNGGGMGAYVMRAYPTDYFSVATSTAAGTFSATNDPMPSRFNQFLPVNLDAPIEGSLEKKLGLSNHVLFTKTDNTLPDKIKMRFIGYGPQSGASTFTYIEPKLLYDAIIYLGKTHAAEHLTH